MVKIQLFFTYFKQSIFKFNHEISDTRIPQIIENGAILDRYLFGRHIPLEQKDVYTAKKDIQKEILRNAGVRHASELGNWLFSK